ncbi:MULTISPECIES: 1,2-phenylacetyl-CoA epoxidase subunit PaaC [unclassified Streptomyces]|uniref:1,2-phenylacetyl-CoA epoxidase subunit PaaC n=1 Tax=unclassified Streptomyces TaxID=2593676 RepID=UPI0035DF178A
MKTYALRLADDALVLSQQLGLWITRAPELEEELALTNIALDLLGQARALLRRAGDEDELAYLRDATGFRNLVLVEQPNRDFAHTMVRQLLFSTFQLARYQALVECDETIAGVAVKAVKEVAYHRHHAAQWVLRLGDGTAESHQRTAEALASLWPFTHEMFLGDEIDRAVGVDPATLRDNWLAYVEQVLHDATLKIPGDVQPCPTGGREGRHTPALVDLLADMQSLYRAHPGASW